MPLNGFKKVFDRSGLQKYQHKNGLTVIFRVKEEAKSVTLGIGTRAGLVHHPLMHLNHHMLFKGTLTKSGTDLIRESARLGDTFDAVTDLYSTLLFIRVTPEHVRRGFRLLCDMVRNPAIKAEDLEKEKHIVIGEIKRWNGEPHRVLRHLIWHALYVRHPAREAILEDSGITTGATREQIIESHRKFYNSPQRLVVVVVGRFQPAKLLKMIAKCLGGLVQSIDDPFGVPEEENPKRRPKPIVRRWHGELTRVMFGLRAPLSYHSDYLPMQLLSAILGEGLDSRLYEELREKTGFVHVRGPLNPTSNYDSSPWHGVFHIYAPCDPKDLPEVEKIIRKELKKLTQKLVSDEELRRNKTKLKQWRALMLMGTKKHTLLLFNAEINGMLEKFDSFPRLIQKITAADIRCVAKKYCLPSKAVCAILKSPKKQSKGT